MNYLFLMAAIMSVESANGEMSGDGGLAQGRLMVHPIMVREVNRVCGTNHRATKAYRREHSEQIFLDYAKYMHVKRMFNVREIAQCWNAGDDAVRKGQGFNYASKVEAMYLTFVQSELIARETWLKSKAVK